MHNLSIIEEIYQQFIRKMPYLVPDGITVVNLELLNRFNLLSINELNGSSLTRYFHVVETPDKITLISDDFIVWIIPEGEPPCPATHVMIALNHSEELKLETAFTASGVYNSSDLVMRVLEHTLVDIQETEAVIRNYS